MEPESAAEEFPERLAKRTELEAAGIPAHALTFERTASAMAVTEEHSELEPGTASGVEHAVAGRVVLRREQGKLVFVVIEDTTGRIQLFCSQGDMTEASWMTLEHLDLGDWLGATGEVMRTRRGEISVKPRELTMLAKALRPLPDKWKGLTDVERRFRQRYLDLAVNEEARAVALARSRMLTAIRSLLDRRDFVEVETPVLQPLYGGATARPFITHHNALDIDLYLRIAPELYLKRLVVGGFERVYEVSRNFRNEGVGTKYNPEFTMIEAYQAFTDYHGMAALFEDIFTTVGATGRLTPPFRRVTMTDLVTDMAGEEISLDLPPDELRRRVASHGVHLEPEWGPGKVLLEAYEKLGEPNLTDPTLVFDWPREMSPLARAHRDDPRLAEQVDLVIDGREIGTAYSELTDPIEQRELLIQQGRFRAQGDEEAMQLDEDFLRALEHGMPPCGGIGFGLDRLAVALTGVDTIREVILFPLMRSET